MSIRSAPNHPVDSSPRFDTFECDIATSVEEKLLLIDPFYYCVGHEYLSAVGQVCHVGTPTFVLLVLGATIGDGAAYPTADWGTLATTSIVLLGYQRIPRFPRERNCFSIC